MEERSSSFYFWLCSRVAARFLCSLFAAKAAWREELNVAKAALASSFRFVREYT